MARADAKKREEEAKAREDEAKAQRIQELAREQSKMWKGGDAGAAADEGEANPLIFVACVGATLALLALLLSA